MNKLLLITQEYSKNNCGGAGVYAYELTNALSKKDWEVHVLAPGKNNKKEKINDNLYIHWQKTIFKPFLLMPSFYLSVKKNYKKIMEKEGIKIVHANGNTGYSISNDIPLISTIHHPVSFDNDNYGFVQKLVNKIDIHLEKKIFHKSKIIVSVSHLTADLLQKKYGKSDKIKILGEGIDLEIFKPTKFDLRKKYNINDDTALIFFPGGARAKRKGAEVAFKAFGKLKKDGNLFKCLISGKSREIGWEKEFHDLIDKYNLKENIILTNELEYSSLPKYYSNSDIVIFPSLFEGFGIPVLEAMACGTPIIASKTGEAPYIIRDGENGFIFDVGDSNELIIKINDFTNNNKLLIDNIIKKNINLIKNNYNWDIIINQYINRYKNLNK